MDIPGYELTAHAAGVVSEREIAITWVIQTLEKPDAIEPDKDDPTLVHALKRILENDGRVLRVVYNATVSPPRIVTAYFDRRRRGMP